MRGLGRQAVIVVALGLVGAAARSETLGEAIAMAYETNPTLQEQRASLRALDETYVQAEAGYRPTVQIQASVTTDTNNNRDPFTRPLPGLSQPIVNGQSQSSGAALSITQPLYTGGRVARAVTAAQAGILAGREELRASEESVLKAVIQAYVDVRRDQTNVAILEEAMTRLLAQQTEARDRFAVGAITRTDVAETEARVAATQAQLESARVQLANSRAGYVALVGQSPGALAPEPALTAYLPNSLDEAQVRAADENPKLRQAAFTERQSAAKLAEAKTQYRPSLSLQATMGYSGGSSGLMTPFANYSHDITASAVATVPLFNGGMTASSIRQAAETNTADRIGIEAARRQAMLLVNQDWNTLAGAKATLAADEAQVKAAETAYEGSRLESRVGLRTTLDVLIAEQTLSGAQLSLNAARHDTSVAAASLLADTGTLNASDLAPEARPYDAKANLAHLKRGWPWTPWTVPVAGLDGFGAPRGRVMPADSPVRP